MNMFDDLRHHTSYTQNTLKDPIEMEDPTRYDLLLPWQINHIRAWDRLREICIGYNVDIPTFCELLEANACAPQGNMLSGHGEDWFDKIGISKSEEQLLLTKNENIILMPDGSTLNLSGGYFIKRPKD